MSSVPQWSGTLGGVMPPYAFSASDPRTGAHRLFAIGEILDDTYEIKAVLGEGGMGCVYDVFDLRLRRRAAIKVARRDVDPSVLRQEAQAVAQVRHPCAASVYGLHVHHGVEYLVMERISGITLEQHLERFRETNELFTIEEALDLLIAIVDGLGAIHRVGLSHRDIKPSNIMIAPGNRVVLMDFGLVLPEVHAGSPAESIWGSPEYMAPESIRCRVWKGSAHLVDLYAVGVVAFEILAGEPPFGGATVKDILMAQVEQEPPPLRERRPDVPEAFAGLVARLLAKDAHLRPESAAGLLAELRAIRAHRDDSAGAENFSEAIRRVRPHPPNVLVLDLQMPDISGLEVCMFLRGTHLAERVKIILVSADADARDVALLRHLGITEYLPKSEKLIPELVTILGRLRKATR